MHEPKNKNYFPMNYMLNTTLLGKIIQHFWSEQDTMVQPFQIKQLHFHYVMSEGTVTLSCRIFEDGWMNKCSQ
jgi:hypothetical protein